MRLTFFVGHGHILLVGLLDILLVDIRSLAPALFMQSFPKQMREGLLEMMVRGFVIKAQEPRKHLALLVIVIPHSTEILERKVHVHARVDALAQPRRLGAIDDHPV